MAGIRQAITVGGLTTDPDTAAFTQSVLAGSTLACQVVFENTTKTISGITDGPGNTWVQVAAADVGAFRFETWWVASATAGATTLSLNFSAAPGGGGARAWLYEAVGLDSAAFADDATSDVSVSIDPIPLATLTATGAGLAITAVKYDTTETFQGWGLDAAAMSDASGGTTTRGGYRMILDNGDLSVAPTVDNSSGATGESQTVYFSGDWTGSTVLYPCVIPPNVMVEGPGDGEWNFSGGGPDLGGLTCFTWRLRQTKGDVASSSARAHTCNQQGDYDQPAFWRWMTYPLEALSLSGTFDLCLNVRARWQDNSLGYTNDSVVKLKVHAYITQGQTVTPRTVIIDNYVDSQTFPGTGGAEWIQLASPQAVSGSILAGDCIMVEVGWRIVSSPTPTPLYPPADWTQVDIRGTDAPGSFPDAIAGETSTSRSPWIAFSQRLIEQARPTANANDACADATAISSFPYASAFIDTSQSQNVRRDAWFSFTAPTTGEMILSTLGSNYDVNIDVRRNGCGTLTLADYGGFQPFGVGRSSAVTMLNATSGVAYLVRLRSTGSTENEAGAGGNLRFTIGYRQTPAEDDLYIPSWILCVFRDGVLINANPSIEDSQPSGITIDYTGRAMENAGGDAGGDPHERERLLVGKFASTGEVQVVDLQTCGFIVAGGSDIDTISDPWEPAFPGGGTQGPSHLYCTYSGFLISSWFGNGFLYVAGTGTSRPAFLNTISSDTAFSAIKGIDALSGDNQSGAPYGSIDRVATVESTAPWGGWVHEATGIIYYVSGSPYDCPLVSSQEIRMFDFTNDVQLGTFATLTPQSVFHPAVRGLAGLAGSNDPFNGLLACNGNTVQRLDVNGSVVGTYTPTTPDANPHIALMDVKVCGDGIHAWTVCYVSRRMWKFDITTMTEVATYPTYMMGPFLQMAVYAPDGIEATPEDAPEMPCIHGSYSPQIALTGSVRTGTYAGSYTPTTE